MRTGEIKDLNIRYLLFRRKTGVMSLFFFFFFFLKNATLNFQTSVKSFDVQFVTFLSEESF